MTRKILARWSVPFAIVLLVIGFWQGTTSAQQAPWRIVQGSDGTMYLVTSDTRYVVSPDPISDDDLATLADGGSLGSQLPIPPAPPPVMVLVPAPAPAQPAPAAPTPTQTPVPVPTNTPVPAAPSTPSAGTHDNPLPMGAVGQLSDGWRIVVASITSDATSLVLQNNQFNKLPTPGNQFFLARIQATYRIGFPKTQRYPSLPGAWSGRSVIHNIRK